TTFTTTTDKTGHYSYTTTVPIDAPFGEYTIVVSDGKNQVSKAHNIVTTHQIILSTSQQEVEPGHTIIINGTSISNARVSIRINDPTGKQVFAKDVNVTSGKQKCADTVLLGADGLLAYSFHVTSYTPGLYAAVVTRGNDKATTNFAIGLVTSCGQITMKPVKDTYLLGDNIIILGNANP